MNSNAPEPIVFMTILPISYAISMK